MRLRNVASVFGAIGLAVGTTLVVPAAATISADEPAGAVLRNQAGATVGSVTFQDLGGGRTQVRARVSGLAPNSEFHGFHVHTNGACEGDFVASAGGHWNPGAGVHGDHAGDMPVLYADQSGVAESSFTTDAFTSQQLLTDPGGVAVIVHAGRDNYANIPARYSVASVPGPDAITNATGDAGARYACGVVDFRPNTAPTGYWSVGGDGGVFAHGTAGFFGSQGGRTLNKPMVAMASTPGGAGYYLTAADGGVFTHGDAGFQGSAGNIPLASPVVDVTLPPVHATALLRDQAGTEIGRVGFTQDGTHVLASAYVTGLAPFAEFHGFHVHTNGACSGDFVASAGGHWNPAGATHGDHAGDMPVLYADANGTARSTSTLDAFTVAGMLADDGGVAVIVHAGRDNYGNIPTRYTVGGVGGPDATTNSTGDAGARLACGVVSAPGGSAQAGYWLAAADGGVFAYGDAPFFGSLGGTVQDSPIVAMTATPSGAGYWLVAADGDVFPFGDAVNVGDHGSTALVGPIVDMAASPTGKGYLLFGSDGGVFAYGDAIYFGRVVLVAPLPLPAPATRVVGADRTESGYGYVVFASDGGVSTFGDAMDQGSEAGLALARPIVGGATRQ